MGAGYMQSIFVPHFRSPVFSELQGPMQDGYGIGQGWIQYLRVCILQALCSCEFVAGQTTARALADFHREGKHTSGAADPSAALRISPADSDARSTAQVVKER